MAKPTIAQRFWRKVSRRAGKDGCWPWTGARTWNGYGSFFQDRRLIRAHRKAWELTFGPIPDGRCVLHHCDVRLCCNPSHLFLGTLIDNINDMNAKGRGSTIGLRSDTGRRLTEEQVLAIRAAYRPRQGAALARQYGVTTSNIAAIVKRKTWAHI